MNDQLKVGQMAQANVIRAAKPTVDMLNPKGQYKVEHFRDGKKIAEYDAPNAITNEGRAKLLNVMFDSGTPITQWWMGIVDSTSYTALAATDTYAQLAGSNGWREYDHYTDDLNSNSGTTRPVWGAGAATLSGSFEVTTNATAAVFDVTSGGSGLVKGLFIVGTAGAATPAQTKDDHTSNPGVNVLWSAALFTGGDVTILTGDQLKITYTVSA